MIALKIGMDVVWKRRCPSDPLVLGVNEVIYFSIHTSCAFFIGFKIVED